MGMMFKVEQEVGKIDLIRHKFKWESKAYGYRAVSTLCILDETGWSSPVWMRLDGPLIQTEWDWMDLSPTLGPNWKPSGVILTSCYTDYFSTPGKNQTVCAILLTWRCSISIQIWPFFWSWPGEKSLFQEKYLMWYMTWKIHFSKVL